MKIEYPDELFDKEELTNTPERVKKYQKELSDNRNYKKFTTFKNRGYDGMVIQRCEFHSTCAHHLLPFFGVAYVGYIPNSKSLTGLSKLARIVDKFASRPQTQEAMNTQITTFINALLRPKGVMVVIKARHMCMECRGVKKSNSWTVTSQIRGVYKAQPHTKAEFFELVKMKFVGGDI